MQDIEDRVMRSQTEEAYASPLSVSLSSTLLTSLNRLAAESAAPGAVRTTADPRPNAYIPDDELGIPRPYGSHAPFKPQEAGSSMRHIRRPVQKEIEI
jgi:hypothetical protein